MAGRFIIRRATLADYRGVMDIGLVYEGRDYLPARYHKYLRSFNCWVSEIDGEIVGFTADRLIDGGQTVATSGGRVKQKYQGYGITTAMLKSSLYRYKGKPSVKYETNTANNQGMSLFGEKIKKRFRIVTQRDNTELEGDASSFRPPTVVQETSENVQQLFEKDVEEMFKSKETCSRLFPDGRIVPDWYPFRLMTENIPDLFDGRRFWGTMEQSGMIKILTITNYFLLGPRLVFKISLYENDEDEEDIRQHMLMHVQNISMVVQKTGSSLIWVHILHESQKPENFLKVFTDSGLSLTDFYKNKMIVLEKEYVPEPFDEKGVRLSKI